jgi:nucleoside-diphosphate-sugar epimerase
MTNILIIGALGFVGRNLIKQLNDFDVSVTIVARPDQHKEAAKLVGVDNIIFCDDVFNETIEWWKNTCSKIEIVIHAAWYTNPVDYLFSEKNFECLVGSINIARGAYLAKCKKFVGIGTCFEYDLKQRIMSVDTSLKPTSPYACCKAALYQTLTGLFVRSETKFTWARLFFVYGEGEHPNKLSGYIRECSRKKELVNLTSGNQIRDYLEIGEASRLIVKATMDDSEGPINVCSGIPITVQQFAERLAIELGCLDLLRFGTRAKNAVDPECVVGIPSFEE